MSDRSQLPPDASASVGSEPLRTLIVEDDEDMRRLIETVVRGRGHEVTSCVDAEAGWAAYQQGRYGLILLDWRLPGMDGLELCRLVRAHPLGDRSIIVMITACDQVDDLNQVLRAGANDYLAKPVSLDLLNVRLRVAEQWVHNLARRYAAEEALQKQEQTVQRLMKQLQDKGRFQDLVGTSQAMRRVYEQIQAVAPVDSTVLIEGETGTGKEMVARAIHLLSQRRTGPFIAVNCAALTDTLLASQLFGHKKGAFTGALDHQQGVFEAAHGGTLFLDEIGDISPAVQKSLLRVLQEKEITRVGESKPRKVDVRIVAATHHNLGRDVAAGSFRADLLYRIRVARIQLPPLRERREDIPLLVASLLGDCAAAMGKPVHSVSAEAMNLLMSYAWPGNVRELKSALEAAVIACAGDVVQPMDIPPEVVTGGRPHHEMILLQEMALRSPSNGEDEVERIHEALKRAKGNRSLAARLLGVSRATFYRRLAELNVAVSAVPRS